MTVMALGETFLKNKEHYFVIILYYWEWASSKDVEFLLNCIIFLGRYQATF